MRVLVIDNYDSFVFNLVYLLRHQTEVAEVTVVRNDHIDLSGLSSYSRILLSPGPGIPSEAGQLMDVFEYLQPHQSLLGVCLGHQALGVYFNAELKQAERVYHGISSSVHIDPSSPLFYGLPTQIDVGRYHSWFVDISEAKHQDFEVIARDEDGNIMGIQSKSKSLYGVQFHPESILCPRGKEIIQNWIKLQVK